MSDEKNTPVAKSEVPTNKEVTLKVKGKDQRRVFPLQQANAILNLRFPAWELDDKNFKWNGKELTIK